MARVNPPPQKVPESLAKSAPELFAYLNDVQFQQYQMWQLSISTTTVLEAKGGSTNALFAKLQQQVGSGQFLTCDDTGFSCDSTEFTCDMDEA